LRKISLGLELTRDGSVASNKGTRLFVGSDLPPLNFATTFEWGATRKSVEAKNMCSPLNSPKATARNFG
jgi:hypothetical protein